MPKYLITVKWNDGSTSTDFKFLYCGYNPKNTAHMFAVRLINGTWDKEREVYANFDKGIEAYFDNARKLDAKEYKALYAHFDKVTEFDFNQAHYKAVQESGLKREKDFLEYLFTFDRTHVDARGNSLWRKHVVVIGTAQHCYEWFKKYRDNKHSRYGSPQYFPDVQLSDQITLADLIAK